LAKKLVKVTVVTGEIEKGEVWVPLEEATEERACWIPDNSERESKTIRDREEPLRNKGERLQIAMVVVVTAVVIEKIEDALPTFIR
jgi:hypothetical protein